MTIERTFDWRPFHDNRSRLYPIRALTGTSVERVAVHHDVGPILNQGGEGHCVGFAWTSEALAKPIPVDLTRLKENVPEDPTEFARFLYAIATHLDPWPGEDDNGTSVLAGAQAAQNLGVLRSYRWAFGIQDVIDALIKIGPVVLGIPWLSGMYEAPNGVLRPTGNVVGGHAILAVGYTPSSDRLGGKETITLQNSWGPEWGINGLAEIAVEDLNVLLHQNGEACVPTSRSYGRS